MASSATRITSTGELTTSTQVLTQEAQFFGFDILPPASGTATLKFYDVSSSGNVAASNLVAECQVSSAANSINQNYSVPRAINRGLYVLVSGTATVFNVLYSI